MIAESAIFPDSTSSIWNSQNLFQYLSDGLSGSSTSSHNSNFESALAESSKCSSRSSDSGEDSDFQVTADEDLMLAGLNAEKILQLTESEFFNTSFSHLDDDLFAEFNVQTPEVTATASFPSVPNTSGPSSDSSRLFSVTTHKERRRRRKLDPLKIKSLSTLSEAERSEVMATLSQIINNMSKQEQRDIIRIADPTAVISNSDTEFVIGVTRLYDDRIWRKVRHYIKRIVKSSRPTVPATVVSTDNLDRDTSNASSTCSSANKRRHKNVGVLNSLSLNNREAKNKRLKKENVQKVVPTAVEASWLDEQKRKLIKQKNLERQSGLFGGEEVLKLLLPTPEEADVDIIN